MQRKNNILRSARSGIAMIMAIAVIVIISTIMALSISLTTQTTKNTIDMYVHEQANLLARSAGEYAKLKIGQVAPCAFPETPGDANFIENSLYHITITPTYLYNGGFSTCAGVANTITQTEDFGAVWLDITVEVIDPTVVSEPIRIFKRKLVEL